MGETYQGCNATLMPAAYAQALRAWCDKHKAVMIFDEVQAGFGRTGTPFGFQHLGIVPDLVACGKGISGGMPLSAVLGTEELMNIYGPGEMTSTHSANPICCGRGPGEPAGHPQREAHRERRAAGPAAGRGRPTDQGGRQRQDRPRRFDGPGRGPAVHQARHDRADPDWAWELVWRCVCKGVMLFAPVGVGGCAIKINPPLVINEEALREGLAVVEEVVRSF